MNTIGLLSIACALGTIGAIFMILYGVWKRSRALRLAGGMGFVVSFMGLLLLISKYGVHSQDQSSTTTSVSNEVKYLVAQWNQVDSTGKMIDLLQPWTAPSTIGLSESRLRFSDNANHTLERSIEIEGDTWKISGESFGVAPLHGHYKATTSGDETILTKIDDGTTENLYLIRKAQKNQNVTGK